MFDLTRSLYEIINLRSRYVAGQCLASLALSHECEGVVLATHFGGLGVDAEVETNLAATRIHHFPVAFEVAHLLKVEETLLS